MPPTKKAAAKEPKAKEAKEKKSSTAARKPTGESNKLLYSAGAIGVALIAGLIGTAHFMKKARRKARIARLACERDPECGCSVGNDVYRGTWYDRIVDETGDHLLDPDASEAGKLKKQQQNAKPKPRTKSKLLLKALL